MSLTQAEAQSVTWQSDRRALDKIKPYFSHGLQLICGLALPVLMLCLWYVATQQQWLPEQILPAPSLVWQSTAELWQSGELGFHFAVSAKRILWSVLIGASVGVLLGTVLGLAKRSRDYVFPTVNLIAQFPIVGWIPLLMIFLGIDEALKIAAISLAVLPPLLIATYKGITQVPHSLMEVADVYQYSNWQKLKNVILPAALPSVISGLRQGIMQAWLALVFVELLASSEGIGYLMVWGRQLMQMDLIFMAIILIGITGYVLDTVFAWLEKTARFHATRVGAQP